MSEGTTYEVQPQKVETTSETPIVTQEPDGIVAESSMEDQDGTELQESNSGSSKKIAWKIVWTKILTFIQNNVFTSMTCKITLLVLEALMLLLCGIQFVKWCLSIKDTYMNYWEAIRTLDIVNIVTMVLMLVFAITLFAKVIEGIVGMIKKGREVSFASVATLFSFAIFSMFMTHLFEGKELLISSFAYAPMLKALVWIVGIYTVVRLLLKDFGARVWSVFFSIGGIILAIVMFTQNAGDFASITFGNSGESVSYSLSELNALELLKVVFFEGGLTDANEAELLLFAGFALSDLGIGEMGYMLCLLMQVVAMLVADLLPYAALSLMGYFLYGLTCRNYVQYYQLRAAQKVATTMLVISVMSLASTIALSVLAGRIEGLTITIDYVSAALTLVLGVAMIVVTALPWKFYNITYNRHFAEYKKNGGGNV